MILNYIWISLILLAVLMGLVQAFCYGNVDIFSAILNSTFDSAKTGFELSLGLTGVLSLWMGIMKIGEKAGAVNTLGRPSTRSSAVFSRRYRRDILFSVPCS